MLSREQALVAADAMLAHAPPTKPARRSGGAMGVAIGSPIGMSLGITISYWSVGHAQPALSAGWGAGAAIGCLVGLYVDRNKSPRGRTLLLVAAISMLAIGTLPLLVAAFIR